MVRLTDTLAVETKAYNIQIFAIRPGWVCTAMSEGVLQSEAGQRWFPHARTLLEQGEDVPPERTAQLVAPAVRRESGVEECGNTCRVYRDPMSPWSSAS